MGDRSWTIASTAASLRRVQVELCDAPAEQRHQRLEEVVSDALNDTLHSERKAFLEGLLEQFPVDGDATPVASAARAEARCARCEQYERQFADPEVLASQLKSALASATPEVQARVRIALGLGTAGAVNIPAEEVDQLRADLKLKGDVQIDPARLANLSAAALAAVLRVAYALYDDTNIEDSRPLGLLENVQAWSSTPRRSESVDQQEQRVKRLVTNMGEYLKGAALTPADRKELAAAMLDATRMLRMPVTSIQNCGPRFWQLFQEAFAPEKLEREAQIETSVIGGSRREEQLWNRFVVKFSQWKRDKWGQNKGGGGSVGADDVRAMIERVYPVRR